MNGENPPVDQFILEQIDTIPHLEALLLVWNRRPKAWSLEEMAQSLYVPADLAAKVLKDLAQRDLIEETDSGSYQYKSHSAEKDALIAEVSETYRRQLIRVSRMIHAKAPSAMRDFAQAFRFTKEKD